MCAGLLGHAERRAGGRGDDRSGEGGGAADAAPGAGACLGQLVLRRAVTAHAGPAIARVSQPVSEQAGQASLCTCPCVRCLPVCCPCYLACLALRLAARKGSGLLQEARWGQRLASVLDKLWASWLVVQRATLAAPRSPLASSFSLDGLGSPPLLRYQLDLLLTPLLPPSPPPLPGSPSARFFISPVCPLRSSLFRNARVASTLWSVSHR